MRTRQELLVVIRNSKIGKVAAILVIISGVFGYVYFSNTQEVAEKELMILDAGNLDETVLQ